MPSATRLSDRSALIFRTVHLLAGLFLVACAAGCGPQNPGDECNPDDGCPEPLVCARDQDNQDTFSCFLPPGEACDAGDADYCLEDAICTEQAICEIPALGACDPEGQNYCEDDY